MINHRGRQSQHAPGPSRVQTGDLWRLLSVLAGLVALAVAAYVFLFRHGLPMRWPGPAVVAACVGFCGVFIACKALALSRCCGLVGIKLGKGESARLMYEGVAIECLSWPGKVWADGYRVRMLGQGTVGKRVQALLLFRLATVSATVIALACAAAAIDGVSVYDALALVGVLLLGGVWLRVRSQTRGDARVAPDARWGWPVLLAVGAVLADVSAAALIAWSITGVDPLLFAGCFLVCGVLASVSGMPMGIGVLDAASWLVLTGLFGVGFESAAAVVLVHRLTGPVLTLLLGSVSLIHRGLPDLRGRNARLNKPSGRTPKMHQKRHATGFSLIELVMVVVIIGIIGAIAIPRLSRGSEGAYRAKAQELDANLERAAIMYLNDHGRMPSTFFNWVGMDRGASNRNYINITAMRSLLNDPDAELMINDEQTIRLEFRSGLIVEYNIDDNGMLSSTYTEPSS